MITKYKQLRYAIFLSGDTKHFNETKQVREKEFVEDSFYLNVTADSKYSSKFEVIFEVCEKLETTPQCTFTWRKPSNNITIVHWNPGNETICSARYHDVNSSLDMFEFHISQLVRRYLSFLKLSITASNEEPKTLSLLCLEVWCKYRYVRFIQILQIVFIVNIYLAC